jgi:hypothetical protein
MNSSSAYETSKQLVKKKLGSRMSHPDKEKEKTYGFRIYSARH